MGFAHFNRPVARWGHWSDDLGPCLVHGQTYRDSFFRGGGLGGRPRTPYDMPSWGRPSWARRGKREQDRERNARHRKESRRFEEIDSDDDDGQGVRLGNWFASDNLYFTGTDVGPRQRNQRNQDCDECSDSIEELNDEISDRSGGVMQLALRDKEETLLHKALERIRRAQVLGEKNVKLTQPEIDALERSRLKEQATRKSKRPKVRLYERHPSDSPSTRSIKEQKLDKSRISASRSAHDDYGSSSPKRGTPPGNIVPGSDGNTGYAPFSQHVLSTVGPHGRSSRSGSRSAVSQGQRQYTPPIPAVQFHSPQTRYFLGPDAPRPSSQTQTHSRRLPDDPQWIRRPRSASSNHSLYADAMQNPPYPLHVPTQFTQGRRVVSGPPESQYPASWRGAPPSARPHAASSESLLRPREHLHEEDSERHDYVEYSDDDEDGGDSYGVQVDVDPSGPSSGINIRSEDYAIIGSQRVKR